MAEEEKKIEGNVLTVSITIHPSKTRVIKGLDNNDRVVSEDLVRTLVRMQIQTTSFGQFLFYFMTDIDYDDFATNMSVNKDVSILSQPFSADSMGKGVYNNGNGKFYKADLNPNGNSQVFKLPLTNSKLNKDTTFTFIYTPGQGLEITKVPKNFRRCGTKDDPEDPQTDNILSTNVLTKWDEVFFNF